MTQLTIEPDFPEGGFNALIFDLDGTLVDSMPAHFEAWCEALNEYGASGVFPEDVFYAMGGRPTKDIVQILNEENGMYLNPESIAMSKRNAFLRRLKYVEPNEKVVNYVRRWRRKVPIGLASGGSRYVVEKTLFTLGLSELFDEVVTADDVVTGKPDPEIYLKTAELLEVEPAECLAFEDAASGVMAAQRAGMEVVAITAPVRVYA